ncbi:MAG: flagellar biosynthesis protein FliQ [Buchnera aphidicola (Periphyllus lyropictus)]|uniref:flagellar biosynthesis protein FliQ n=1 Tax=Buchnera aphidicola TaxID=9 RepID=UPI001EBA716B|nr:flagellar biosynthesis protein FliQ [Buchnera aphidicola]NIH16747.1 flagellar biosynthesis protein FliQ [Buchnera aphidicola (Periphyllus lyropictus)]USS94647.1 flagellar biosynthesis protein FliQ [Buchnera aphidicola (Periphyllus lyropictus)]
MNINFLQKIFFDASKTLLMLSSPILLSVLLSGLVISIFQAATQINEQTLSFIPKVISVLFVLFFLGPWMLRIIINYIDNLFNNMPLIIGS